MAEYDNIQLYSNYQSYNIANDDEDSSSTVKFSKSRIVWNNKRKKINHHDERITAVKCQRPNNNYRSDTTRLIASSPSSNDRSFSQTLLITNHHNNTDNNHKKSVAMRNYKKHSSDESLNEDNSINRKRTIRKYFSCYNKSNVLTLALLLVLGFSFKINLCCGFVLDGTQNSYAQFRKWYSGLNGTLELEFKTEQPNGLVLYTDDGGTYDFFELKLVEGALRLRYNLGGGAQIITVGRDLHDGHWHKVQVRITAKIKTFKHSKTFSNL